TAAVSFPVTGTAPTEIYTLSLHDALPISAADFARQTPGLPGPRTPRVLGPLRARPPPQCGPVRAGAHCPAREPAWVCRPADAARSEEHTSELQSRENLVCRLLLEKKKMIR